MAKWDQWRQTRPQAMIVLEDGTTYQGYGFGHSPDASGVVGELVFNTSMTGYQEILTDPSYAGQIVTLTSSHIGNYGIAQQDMESMKIQARALVVRDLCDQPSNWRSDVSLSQWMESQSITGISDVDTRALTRRLRDGGVVKALIVHASWDADVTPWVEQLATSGNYGDQDFVAKVQTQDAQSVRLEEGVVAFDEVGAPESGKPHVVVVDFGAKHSILKHLLSRGCAVTLVPGFWSAEKILALKPDGVMLSNGPGDPARMDAVLDDIRALMEQKPTYGICLGHQLMARALGAQTVKLHFGHRGPNQPVKALTTGKVSMTSQNHGYAVSSESMPSNVLLTHVNLNDNTVAGFRHKHRPVFAVQYHPEAGPGPHDASDFFDEFLQSISA